MINDIFERTRSKSKKYGQSTVSTSMTTMNQLYEANTALKSAHPEQDGFPDQKSNMLQMGFKVRRSREEDVEEAEDINRNERKKCGRWDNEL